MNDNNVGTEFKPLDIEGLKIYKKQNPAKFAHKFGDLDLDNLPEGFGQEDINRARFLRTQKLPKPRLMSELEVREYGAPERKEPTMEEVQAFLAKNGMTVTVDKVATEEKVEEKEETVQTEVETTTSEDGGATLEEAKTE